MAQFRIWLSYRQTRRRGKYRDKQDEGEPRDHVISSVDLYVTQAHEVWTDAGCGSAIVQNVEENGSSSFSLAFWMPADEKFNNPVA